MRYEQSYRLDTSRAIIGIEDLAESLIAPKYREAYTIRGLTQEQERDESRPLLPNKYRSRLVYQAATGVNYPVFAHLLNAAQEVHTNGQFSDSFSPPQRLYLAELVCNNLQENKSVVSVLKEYDVLGRDDLLWFFWLRYTPGELVCALGDNTQWTHADAKFRTFYQNYLGRFFEIT